MGWIYLTKNPAKTTKFGTVYLECGSKEISQCSPDGSRLRGNPAADKGPEVCGRVGGLPGCLLRGCFLQEGRDGEENVS